MRSLVRLTVALLALSALPAFAADRKNSQAQDQQPAPSALDAAVDRIFYREAQLVGQLRSYTPLVETYIQNMKPDADLGRVPTSDKYFLGRLSLANGLKDTPFERKHRGFRSRVIDRINNFYRMNYVPLGFMQLVYIPAFDRKNYDLRFLRREFLGDVRCAVFEVSPRPKQKGPHFVGRIWVEDQDYTIVRMNGTYEPQSRTNFFFHFDSWRINARPGMWLPAYIYTEESDAQYALFRRLMMKGQTRFWGYDLKHSAKQEEFTDVMVDAPADQVRDQTGGGANEIQPITSEHVWEREAEDNVLDRLERAGLLAPPGEVDKVLQTVANNLEITNNLDLHPEVRCRVLMTMPLESFSVGHTIVVSRGLLDVLPDEASLAMVVAHELGHIALGHHLDTKYAFSDRMIFPDEDSFQKLVLAHDDAEEAAADQKGLELLKNSPYKDKLGNAGLFLRSLDERSKELPSLINPHFGNRMAKADNVLRMAALMQSAPQLKVRDVSQIAALPLGSRIKIDPWDDHLELQKSKPDALYSARDKMVFEVTPMIPNLARYKGPNEMASTQVK